ncbi:MAG: hypothetical protein QF637_12115, partial [Acidimicrobiales bacterium]|nr:hypothetical protein [Acidimicrobiales bacterium]
LVPKWKHVMTKHIKYNLRDGLTNYSYVIPDVDLQITAGYKGLDAKNWEDIGFTGLSDSCWEQVVSELGQIAHANRKRVEDKSWLGGDGSAYNWQILRVFLRDGATDLVKYHLNEAGKQLKPKFDDHTFNMIRVRFESRQFDFLPATREGGIYMRAYHPTGKTREAIGNATGLLLGLGGSRQEADLDLQATFDSTGTLTKFEPGYMSKPWSSTDVYYVPDNVREELAVEVQP